MGDTPDSGDYNPPTSQLEPVILYVPVDGTPAPGQVPTAISATKAAWRALPSGAGLVIGTTTGTVADGGVVHDLADQVATSVQNDVALPTASAILAAAAAVVTTEAGLRSTADTVLAATVTTEAATARAAEAAALTTATGRAIAFALVLGG